MKSQVKKHLFSNLRKSLQVKSLYTVLFACNAAVLVDQGKRFGIVFFVKFINIGAIFFVV